VHRQENSSFANFGRVSTYAVCECAVLCVGIFNFFFVLMQQKILCHFVVCFVILQLIIAMLGARPLFLCLFINHQILDNASFLKI